jgi:hypothetical protein
MWIQPAYSPAAADACSVRPPPSKKQKCSTQTDLALQIRRLEEQLTTLTERWQTRQRKDVEEQIAHLQQQQVAARPEPATDSTVAAHPKAIKVTTTRNHKKVTVYLAESDMCKRCSRQMVMIPGAALLSCTECGTSKPYLDATSASTAYGEEVEFSNFSYKRSNHFQEWLNSFQAKETTEIPAIVFSRVMEELYRQRLSDLNQITTKKVREVLKDLKLRKYYEHVTQITCRLNGKQPPRMSPDQEEQCRLMFMAIQGPFEKNCPPDRKNFLSYSYCLYKFCELMGYDEFLPCFSLLKGRDKLFKQDMIFKLICDDLGWTWLPSI